MFSFLILLIQNWKSSCEDWQDNLFLTELEVSQHLNVIGKTVSAGIVLSLKLPFIQSQKNEKKKNPTKKPNIVRLVCGALSQKSWRTVFVMEAAVLPGNPEMSPPLCPVSLELYVVS